MKRQLAFSTTWSQAHHSTSCDVFGCQRRTKQKYILHICAVGNVPQCEKSDHICFSEQTQSDGRRLDANIHVQSTRVTSSLQHCTERSETL